MMLVRLLKSNVWLSVFSRTCAVPCPAGQLQLSCSFSSVLSSVLLDGKVMKTKQYGGRHIRRSLHSETVNSTRRYHKLFVGNLPEDATEEVLRQHFSRYGMVLSARVVRDAERLKSQEHGYVVFADKEALDAAVNSEHLVGDRSLSISPINEVKFVVHGLSSSTTCKSLRTYFSQFGRVSSCFTKRDSAKGIDHAFVNFQVMGNVGVKMGSQTHVIDGKQVQLVRIFPKELTLYVGNISPSTTDKSLVSYFSQFGNVMNAKVGINRRTGESQGFAYVTFSSQQELSDTLSSLPHVIDGKEVRLEYRAGEFQLFVSGLPRNASEKSLRQYFEQYGPVYDCRIARDKNTNELQNFGWIVFSSPDGLNNALAARPHKLNNWSFEVSKAGKEAKGGKACTFLVGGLSPRTSDQMLYDVFSKFGYLVSCKVKYDKTSGSASGLGHLSYSTPDGVAEAMLAGPHIVDGRLVYVKKQYHSVPNSSSSFGGVVEN